MDIGRLWWHQTRPIRPTQLKLMKTTRPLSIKQIYLMHERDKETCVPRFNSKSNHRVLFQTLSDGAHSISTATSKWAIRVCLRCGQVSELFCSEKRAASERILLKENWSLESAVSLWDKNAKHPSAQSYTSAPVIIDHDKMLLRSKNMKLKD